MPDTAIRDKIIDYIRRNRVSSTEVADCLGKTGAIPDVRAITSGHFCVGPVHWIYTYEETNWPLHEQAEVVPENSVVLVEAFDCQDRAIFGDIVAKYLILYKQASAIVVTGNLRDVHRLIKEHWPIWCTGFSPVGCFNRKPSQPFDEKIIQDRRQKYEGAVAVCDDTGTVIIPPEELNDSFIEKLEAIEEQEDVWYECIDRKKWSTFKTICLKAYQEDSGGK